MFVYSKENAYINRQDNLQIDSSSGSGRNMIVQHSQKFIVELLETVLQPKSHTALKNAENLMQQISQCDNFAIEMIALSLRPYFKQLKLLAISVLKNRIQNRQSTVNFALIKTIFQAMRSIGNSTKFKNHLADSLNKAYQHTNLNKSISQMVIQMIETNQLQAHNIELVSISKIIISQDYTGEQVLLFINGIFVFLKQMGNYLIYNHNYCEILGQWVDLMRRIVKKWQYMSEQQCFEKYNDQFTGLLISILQREIKIKPLLLTIKLKTNALINQILEQIIQTVPYTKLENFPIISKMDVIIEAILVLIQDTIANMQQSNQYLINCFIFIHRTVKITIISMTFSRFTHSIIKICLETLHLCRISKENNESNPKQFVYFLYEIFGIQTRASQTVIDNNEPSQNQQLKDELSLEKTVSSTLQLMCRNQQKYTIQLILAVLKILEFEKTSVEINYQTCLLLLGILKKQILKRPSILNRVITIIFKLIHSKKDTLAFGNNLFGNTEIIRYTILLSLLEKYLQQLTINKLIEDLLFAILSEILFISNIENARTIISLNIIEHFMFKQRYAIQVLSLFNFCIAHKQEPLFLNQIMEKYQIFVEQIMHISAFKEPNISQILNIGINSIMIKIKNWIKSMHYFLVNSSIRIICKYCKGYMSVSYDGNQRQKYLIYMQSLYRILTRQKCDISRVTLDTQFLEIIKYKIMHKHNITKDQISIFSIILIDYSRNHQKHIRQQIFSIISTMVSKDAPIQQSILSLIIKVLTSQIAIGIGQQEQIKSFKATLYIQQIICSHSHSITNDNFKIILSSVQQSLCHLILSPMNLIKVNLLLTQLMVYISTNRYPTNELMNIQRSIKYILNFMQYFGNSKRTSKLTSILLCKSMKIIITQDNVTFTSTIYKQILKQLRAYSNFSSPEYMDRNYQQIDQQQYHDLQNERNIRIDVWEQFQQLNKWLRNHKIWRNVNNLLTDRQKSQQRSLLRCRQSNDNQTRIIFDLQRK